jgi:predicted DNA-binding transcriptional regulator AlpA
MNPEKLIAAVMAASPDRHDAIIEAVRGKPKRKPQPITAREACSILGCCRATLRRMEMRGLIKPVRLSKRLLRYQRADVEALLTINN